MPRARVKGHASSAKRRDGYSLRLSLTGRRDTHLGRAAWGICYCMLLPRGWRLRGQLLRQRGLSLSSWPINIHPWGLSKGLDNLYTHSMI